MELEKVWEENHELREKLRDLEDRSRRDNIRVDGLEEYENEKWEETEELLVETFSNYLGIGDVKIERAHRVGDPKVSTKRTIVAKLSSYKEKQKVLSRCNRLKGTGIFVNEDFSKETLEIRKKNWGRVKELHKQGKYAILVYDRVYTR